MSREWPEDPSPFWIWGTNGLCDVGGCGNAATDSEVSVWVAESGLYLEVSLCSDHPELSQLIREGETHRAYGVGVA